MLHNDVMLASLFYGNKWYHPELCQGVVTYTSPVEAFTTAIKNLDWWKSSLIACSLRSEALDRLILWEFKGQNVATPAKYLRKCVDQLILVAQNSSWSLDRLLKRCVDCLIPLWSQSQTLVQTTSMWLPLDMWVLYLIKREEAFAQFQQGKGISAGSLKLNNIRPSITTSFWIYPPPPRESDEAQAFTNLQK